MGRWTYSSKVELDSLKQVSVYWLKKNGYFNGYVSGGIEWNNNWADKRSSIHLVVYSSQNDKYANLSYTQTDNSGDERYFDYNVKIVTTPCYFGGYRYWFICPLTVNGQVCGRRVAKLYKAGNYFGCRHCQGLTYSSKNINRHSQHYHALYSLDLFYKKDKIEQQVRRKTYAGKPTKKQKRLDKLQRKIFYSYSASKGIYGQL